MLEEAQTWDEAIHLAAGYSYLKTGDYRMNPEHPPLGKILSALPLLFLKPAVPQDRPAWAQADALAFGSLFLYENRAPAETMLFLGRSTTIAVTLLLGVSIAFWTRAHFGPAPALFALFLFTTDPNIVAHGRYVTSDMVLAFFVFLTMLAWSAFLTSRSTAALLAAGLSLGLAVASKYSALFLWPVLIILYLIRAWQAPGLGIRRFLGSMLVLMVGATTVLGTVYARETKRLPRTELRLSNVVDRSAPGGEILYRLGSRFNLPAHSYLIGLNKVAAHYQGGHENYLLGKVSQTGWWYYFPIAFAVKTPVATLALVLLSLGTLAAWLLRQPARVLRKLRAAPFCWFVLAVPVVVYWAFSIRSRLNLGLRHLLPVYPMVYIAVSVVLFLTLRRVLPKALPLALLLLISLQIFEFARIHPHYLAFFNLAAGGPSNGPRYLLDSNIDWGQDLKRLKRYLDSRGIAEVCLCYFGSAPLWHYGILSRELPEQTTNPHNLDCVAAISVTPLYGLYVSKGAFEWLRPLQPFQKIGYSIYLYDFRK